MKMTDKSEKYNKLLLDENPYTMFGFDSVYNDYGDKIQSTKVYEIFSKNPLLAKTQNWDISRDDLLAGHLMLGYASILELMMNDDLTLTFYDIFPNYCRFFVLGDRGPFFADIFGNTIFHYDAINGKDRRIKYAKLFIYILKSIPMKERTVSSYSLSVATILNKDSISVYDVSIVN